MYAAERKVAQLAVSRACRLAKTVANASRTESITKSDDSPVTVADFGAQAIIISAINKAFPNDQIVGEEDAAKLRNDSNLRNKVWDLVKDASNDSLLDDIGKLNDAQEMCDTIDRGCSTGGNKGRIWALDPIDGTKGFIRRGQYAVCLALMVDGKVELGVIGCPNLDQDGSLFSAVKSQGATVAPLSDISSEKTISFNKCESLADATFCESVEAGHSSHSTQAAIAAKLGITKPPVRMDSQAKYCSISRGQGDIYLRLPVKQDYEEKIWDHAAGNVLVTEAGGTVTDMHGNPLDFGVGRTLKNNKGVIASASSIHERVLGAVKECL